MNSADEESSSSASTGTCSASTEKKISVKVAVVASKSYQHGQLGGRSSTSTQIELSSDRKKHQGFCPFNKEHTFESMLECVKHRARCAPECKGSCACMLGY